MYLYKRIFTVSITMWINYGKLFALQINISFLHACFFKMLETITHSKITQRKKNNFQYCIDYESNKYMVRFFFNFDVLIITVAIWSLYTSWNFNWLEKYMSICTPSFLFHNNNSVIISKLEKWIMIPACFRNGKFHTLALNFKD